MRISPQSLVSLTAISLSLCAAPATVQAGAVSHSKPEAVSAVQLTQEILAADALLFDLGFNSCDLPAIDRSLVQDVTMLHDEIGPIKGKSAFLAQFKTTICADANIKPVRSLDEHTSKVFPLYRDGKLYGALHSGQHSFYLDAKGEPRQLTSRARFLNEWVRVDSGWKLQRTYSFAHLDTQKNNPIDADVLEGGFDRLNATEFLMASQNVKAQSVAILRGGRVAEVRSFGSADGKNPTSLDTLYNAASLAKPVTALTVLRLVSAGQWDLDTPLAEHFLEDVLRDKPQAQHVTTRHILTHSSGLPNWRYLTDDKVLDFAFEPGERFEYSGEGFEWLRQAVEAETGRSIEELAREFVFAPAGMTSTSYLYPFGDEERLALRYDENGHQHDMSPHTKANGAANLITTAQDYARLLAFIARGADLDEALAKEMISPQIAQDERMNFGLGWSILDLKGGAVLQHSGSDPGVGSLALVWPESGDGIVFLSNSDGAIPTWQLILTEVYADTGSAILEANGR